LASHLRSWLESIGLGAHAERFELDRIDFDVLPELTEQDFEALGVPLGDRKRLLKAIAALAGASPEAAAAAPATIERRHVTVLFADLSGYTQLTSALGAEATHRLVQRFYQCVSEIVRDHSGSIERHIGDAVMAVFGLPVAHGNDAERALHAALAVHAAMPSLTHELRLGDETGHPLSVHAGIASGQVVASRAAAGKDFAIVGDAVNLAARLVALAEAGETVMSGAVLQAVAGLADAEAIGEVRVKGFDQAVQAWRLRGWRSGPRPGTRAPLVGREIELGQLREACTSCLQAHTGHVVVVRGEAGIGKTRLVEELEQAAAQSGFVCHKGLTLDFGLERMRDAIGRVLAGVLGIADGSDAEGRGRTLRQAIERGMIAPEERVFAHDALDVPLDAEMQATYDAMDDAARTQGRRQLVLRLLQRASARQPRLVIVEDIHWAGREMLDTLTEIGAGIEGHPIVLAVTTRPEGDPLDGRWRSLIGARVAMLTLDLRPLRAAEAHELARSLAAASDAVLDGCVARADGNPLFLEQLLRNAAAGQQDSLPGSIHSLVLSRLDRLAPRDRRAIQAASALGQCFPLPLLRHLLDDPDYACDALVQENLVRPFSEQFLFAHALVWEGTYASLLTEQKAAWHRAAAQWYAHSDPALSAEHLERAQDPRAARAYLDAARAEKALHHMARAAQLLERGAALATITEDRIELLAELGALLPGIGRPQDAIAVYEQLLALADDDRLRCRAKIGLAAGMRACDRRVEALATLDEAQSLAAAPGFELERAEIHYLRGSVLFPLGNVRGCLEEHTRALAGARAAGSLELELRALSGLGDAHYAGGRLVSSFECFRECVALSRKHHFVQIEAANLPMMAFCAFLMGRLDESLALARDALEVSRRVMHRRGEAMTHHSFAMVHLQRNEPQLALLHAQQATDVARAAGARLFEYEGLLFSACALAQLGDRRQAQPLLREVLAAARDSLPYVGPWILGALARTTDDAEECERCLDQAESLLHASVAAHNDLGFALEGLEACLERGDVARALRCADHLESAFAAEPVPFTQFLAARARALGAWAQGERGSALHSEIQRLIAQARDGGLLRNLPALERAARDLGPEARPAITR
jgi:class 3 adenylate cyclase/tetratricopeptide (TPR) repeat protein